jgi:hypothetical protein
VTANHNMRSLRRVARGLGFPGFGDASVEAGTRGVRAPTRSGLRPEVSPLGPGRAQVT